jgi:23S rRNA U2552 (ribose-2'-O)-methylase RlmE/FtsJ
MEPIPRVHSDTKIHFVLGNFQSSTTKNEILRFARSECTDQCNAQTNDSVDMKLFDVILSDMMPNASGNRDTDHIRSIELAQEALDFSLEYLKSASSPISRSDRQASGSISGGSFLCKYYQGQPHDNH